SAAVSAWSVRRGGRADMGHLEVETRGPIGAGTKANLVPNCTGQDCGSIRLNRAAEMTRRRTSRTGIQGYCIHILGQLLIRGQARASAGKVLAARAECPSG